MNTSSHLEYCAQLVRQHRVDIFYASLYLPPVCRAQMHALVALEIEVSHIRIAVREELIAHMRYAWWDEALEKTYAGQPPAGHPVLEAWNQLGCPLARVLLEPLVMAHRQHFPAPPPDEQQQLDALMQVVVEQSGPAAQTGWQRATGIITAHRQRFGSGGNGWLALKLLARGLRTA